MIQPKVIWNAKDHPELHSGYGVLTRHLVPRLVNHYGSDSVLVYAPVYAKRVEDWNGIYILPGDNNEYEGGLLLNHYEQQEANLLITVGDWFQFRQVPQWAGEDKITWVQWGAYDFLNTPPWLKDILRFALKVVPFCDDAGERFRKLGLENVTDSIYLGLDQEIWTPFQSNPDQASQIGFQPDTYNIVIVAANQHRKNIREMLEGIKMFHEMTPEAKCRIYLHTMVEGDRNIELDLKELELEKITTLPSNYDLICGTFTEAQMSTVFNAADIVLDVCMEGFGLSQTQAQAFGIPVVYLNEGAGAELVKYGCEVPYFSVDRNHNLSKPIPNPGNIAEAIDVLWREFEKGNKRSDTAIKWTQENLGWDLIAEKWISMIDEIMAIQESHSYYIPSPAEHLIERSKNMVELA